MGALAVPAVGRYLNRHFISTYVKVGTFEVVDGEKQGGNVACYFCLPDGRVLHIVAGPVDAGTFLREARWAVDLHKLAWMEGKHDADRCRKRVMEAHAERTGMGSALWTRLVYARDPDFADPTDPATTARMQVLERYQHLPKQERVHLLLTLFPLVKLEDVYAYVFETILNEKVSALPVTRR